MCFVLYFIVVPTTNYMLTVREAFPLLHTCEKSLVAYPIGSYMSNAFKWSIQLALACKMFPVV